MKPHFDKSADALYIRLDDSAIVESEEISPGIVIDYNESNEMVGIEVLYVSDRARLARRTRAHSGSGTVQGEFPARTGRRENSRYAE